MIFMEDPGLSTLWLSFHRSEGMLNYGLALLRGSGGVKA